jgi:hypothetical protein
LVTFLYQDKKVTGVRGNAPFKTPNAQRPTLQSPGTYSFEILAIFTSIGKNLKLQKL